MPTLRLRPGTSFILLCLSILLGFAGLQSARAQEFNCTVSVDIQRLSGNNFGFLKELEQNVYEYVNNHAWTEDRFEEEERIDCRIDINFEQAITLTSFKAQLIVASRRPIYNTTQYTTVVQFIDNNWQFDYVQGKPLTLNLEQYDPLTSVIDFYVYMMLGYDYDTFSELGGTPHFERARRIAERAQGLSAMGWSEVGSDRGRMDLVTQILDPRYRPLRLAYFNYHFGGLDRFVIDTDEARANVLAVLESLDAFAQDHNRVFVMDVFFSSKYQELDDIFLGSQLSTQAYDLLTGLDPSHMTEYNKLIQ